MQNYANKQNWHVDREFANLHENVKLSLIQLCCLATMFISFQHVQLNTPVDCHLNRLNPANLARWIKSGHMTIMRAHALLRSRHIVSHMITIRFARSHETHVPFNMIIFCMKDKQNSTFLTHVKKTSEKLRT